MKKIITYIYIYIYIYMCVCVCVCVCVSAELVIDWKVHMMTCVSAFEDFFNQWDPSAAILMLWIYKRQVGLRWKNENSFGNISCEYVDQVMNFSAATYIYIYIYIYIYWRHLELFYTNKMISYQYHIQSYSLEVWLHRCLPKFEIPPNICVGHTSYMQ